MEKTPALLTLQLYDSLTDGPQEMVIGGGNSDDSKGSNNSSEKIMPPGVLTYMEVIKVIKLPAFTVACNFFVTLALFPVLTGRLLSATESLNHTDGGVGKDGVPDIIMDGGWFSIIVVALFSVGDTIGRQAPLWPMFVVKNAKNQVHDVFYAVLSAIRLLFIPALYFILKAQPASSDFVVYAWMIVFAISNGWCATCAMMSGPELVSHANKGRAGTVMITCLTLGLTAGSYASTYILDMFFFHAIQPAKPHAIMSSFSASPSSSLSM
jgi:hypothetical protein